MFEPHGFSCSPPTAVIICWEAASLPALPVETAEADPDPAQWANACWVTKNSDAMLLPHGFSCSPPTAVIICWEAASLPAFPVATAGLYETTAARCGAADRVEP